MAVGRTLPVILLIRLMQIIIKIIVVILMIINMIINTAVTSGSCGTSDSRRASVQSYISKGNSYDDRAQALRVRSSYVSTLCPVVICPSLCTSDLLACLLLASAGLPLSNLEGAPNGM